MDHCGKLSSGLAKDGRAEKTRRKGLLKQSINTVLKVKASNPVPSDVVKTSQGVHGQTTSYNQGWRSLNEENKMQQIRNENSYQLIGPYLTKLKEKNPDSGVNYELDDEGHITRLFVLPGKIYRKLRFVRPVISVDACHLRSKYKGTLYTATAMSAANEIYPFAFAITKDNENLEGWTYFLKHLKENLPMLHEPNLKERCVIYAKYSFISDRDKGLISAMKNVFPTNLHTNCLMHISKNVQNNWKKVPWRVIFNIGKSFNISTEIIGFEELNKVCPEALDYCLNIDPKLWRCTEWTKNMSLPPRYNMYTSNISESTNSMLDGTRDHSWLYTIDSIINIMIRRHDQLFRKYEDFKDKDEVVPEVQAHMRLLYDASSNFEVFKINEHLGEYKINRTVTDVGVISLSHCININEGTCTCGKWQDREYPCIDALAFYRNYAKLSFRQILEDKVSPYYNCKSLYFLWKSNICPVIISTLEYDTGIKAPILKEETIRQSGRPQKNRRFRPRSKYSNPEDSKVICKKCGEHGHNRKTCEIRKYLEALQEELKKKQELERSTVATITNSTNTEINNSTNTEINMMTTTISSNNINTVMDDNNVTAAAAVDMINDNTTVEDSNVLAIIAPVPAPAPIHNTIPVQAPVRNNNEFALHSTVSIDVIKAMDPGYETNIL